jgi:hypothetical protein
MRSSSMLAFIGEENPDEISRVLVKYRADTGALAYYFKRTQGAG